MSDAASAKPRWKTIFRVTLAIPEVLVMFLVTLWAFGAIYYDGPLSIGYANGALGAVWFCALIGALIRWSGAWRRRAIWAGGIAVVVVPWLFIQPSHDRPWQAPWQVMGTVEIDGDLVTIHGFRNFDYALDGTVTERWESRTVRLSNLRGVDLFLSAFMGKKIAHSMLSFDFGPDGHVALSVETRREVGEAFSDLGGLYKMFELQYIFADERDLIRVRTNIREEPVYLYRGMITPGEARSSFRQIAEYANEIAREPRFYNIISANCTTSIYAQVPASRRTRLDYRLLLNGRLDELLYEQGSLRTEGLSFQDLRRASLINEVALDAHDDPEFSKRIRAGLPWFDGE